MSEIFVKVVDSRKLLASFILSISLLILAVDYFNPFLDFIRSWSILYIWKNLWSYLVIYSLIYFLLGFLFEREDTGKLFVSCLWIPLIHYVLKGVVLSCIISVNPQILVMMGPEIGTNLTGIEDFWVFYFGSLILFAISIWAIMIVFATAGIGAKVLWGDRIGKLLRNIRRALRSGD